MPLQAVPFINNTQDVPRTKSSLDYAKLLRHHRVYEDVLQVKRDLLKVSGGIYIRLYMQETLIWCRFRWEIDHLADELKVTAQVSGSVALAVGFLLIVRFIVAWLFHVAHSW